MVDNTAIARWPDPYYTELQASSYDRKSVTPGKPGWFANDDRSQYIRTEDINGRHEQVMMDADGPGAIVRFWLTTFKRNGVIRIYFDNKSTPVLTIDAYDLMQSKLPLGPALLQPHSSYEPKEKGGSTLYMPMPYAKHCKVTFEDRDTDNQPRYYQINYRKYSVGTRVITFNPEQLNMIKPLLDSVDKALLNPVKTASGSEIKMDKPVAATQEASITLPKGVFAVHYLSIKIATKNKEDYEKALRSTFLKIKFDGEQTVYCPLADFSGSGAGGKPLQSWYRTVTTDGDMISSWVMPYHNTAEISLLNSGGIEINASLLVKVSKWKWDNRSMYFHADWKNEPNVPIKQTEADGPIEWDFNKITGRGIFIGDTFSVYNHMHKWYGEGDQKLWIDDASFPAEYGTGTEDYYNTSWAPVVLYQTPFANAPRADNGDSFGFNTFTRTRNLDAVPFKTAFRYSLEMLGWENGAADCAATTYWYGFKNAKSLVVQ